MVRSPIAGERTKFMNDDAWLNAIRKFSRPREEMRWRGDGRSEEHTSELQSLMRISYAVFCLKQKTNLSAQSKTNYPPISTQDQHFVAQTKQNVSVHQQRSDTQ